MDQVQVTSDHAVPVETLGGNTITVTVLDGDTVYYADTPQVSASGNQGQLTAGQSATFTVDHWVRSASLSTLQIARSTPKQSFQGGVTSTPDPSSGTTDVDVAGSVGVARSTDGSFGLSAPTGSGFEAVFVGGALDHLAMNGVEL